MGELSMYRQLGVKPNFTEIGRKCGLNRHTVAKYWRRGDEIEDHRRDKASAFDEFREVIERKAALPGVTKMAIHGFLMHRHPVAGIPGYNAFTQYCRRRDIECAPAQDAEPRPRFETPPGRQLQFDWKEGLEMVDANGEVFGSDVFFAVPGCSRAHRFMYSRTRTEDDPLACLLATFARFGGIPEEAITDNMSALVSLVNGKRARSEHAWRFAREAGFGLKPCRASTPQTKGKDESFDRFVNRPLAHDRDFGGEQGIVDAIARIEARSSAEPNETTGLPPAVLFMREKEHLRPVGNMRLLQEMVGNVSVQRVPATMLVRAVGRQWSVPRACIGRDVHVIAMPSGQVRAALDGETVAVHDASATAGPINYAEDHSSRRFRGSPGSATPTYARRRAPTSTSSTGWEASGMAALSESSPYVRAQANLSELRLDQICAAMPDYVRMVADGGRDFAQAVAEMTQAEVIARRDRVMRQRIRSSGFPYAKRLADFDWSFQPSVPRAKVEELATLRFMDAAENVLLVGSPGVGKTHLAVAIGIEAVGAGREVRFADCTRLVDDLKNAASWGTLEKRLRYYAHSKLMIIDELGYLDMDEQGADLMFQLISTRYEKRSTIITTNVGIGGWANVFGDDVAASAIADEVCHHRTLVKITGRSHRLKDLPADKRRGG